MLTAPEIVALMRQAVPPGRETLDDASLTRLQELTRALLEAKPDAQQEYARFLAISERALPLPDDELDAWLRGKTVVVVGGTGCIGSKLMQQVEIRCPKRLVSVGRGVTDRYPRLPGAEYLQADIRDRQRLTTVLAELQPDVVFHVAAQRDPGLAEQEVHRTLSTNVLGTQNVIKVAAELGVPQVVCASTGKALRPYSPDVYTASKRVAEWLVAAAAESSSTTTYSTARFTHVVDNSIIHGRLLDWCRGGVIRLHSADIGFYGESALESAQLLLAAGLGARPGELRVHAITDLGWPVTLLDVTLGRAGPHRVRHADLRQRLRPRLRAHPVPRTLRPADRRRGEPAAQRVRGGHGGAHAGRDGGCLPAGRDARPGAGPGGCRNWTRRAAARRIPRCCDPRWTSCPGPCSTRPSARWTSRCWPGPRS